MIDQDFCTYLEYHICKTLANSENIDLKGFWCDGILRSEPDVHYSHERVKNSEQVKLKAFIGKNGQDEYELILKFGDESLSRYTSGLSIKDCLPDMPDSFDMDVDNRRLEIFLL